MDAAKLEDNLKKHVVKLSDEIGERNFIHYDALNEAADYIISEFESYNYKVRKQTYSIEGKDFSNIIAEKKGELKPDQIIVIGAHYDSVIGSPGANDNGSGVAVLLELARSLAGERPERTVKFVAFVNEEPPFFPWGKMGSKVYAGEAKKRGDDIIAMLCLETMGYYSDEPGSQSYPLIYGLFYPDKANFIGVVGNFGSYRLVNRVKDIFKAHSNFNIESVTAPSFVPGVDYSDHVNFWKNGYKACMITDTAFYRYPYYHSLWDTYDKISFDKLAEVTEGLYFVILNLANEGA